MQVNKNTAIIVAAGNGSRLGSDTPKQFLLLAGREILSYSVQTFLEHPQVDHVIIVTSEAFQTHVATQHPNCQVILGGPTRPDSVLNGLGACPHDTRFVLIHDAARPLIPPRIIDACLQRLETVDGVAPAIKPVDTIVQINGDQVIQLNRDDLRRVQTPQCFHLDILRKAYQTAQGDTDEMGLVKRTVPGARLDYIEGALETMKVTTPEDLILLKYYANPV